MANRSDPPESGSSREADQRLGSWKEIAGYLGRDVRTVQRWERNQRLPVHRHQHNRLSTAYAYKSELDAWWTQRPTDNPGETSAPPADVDRDVLQSAASSPPPAPSSRMTTAFASASPDQHWWHTKRPLGIAALVLLAATIALVVGIGRRDVVGSNVAPLPFVEADWVLITTYENHTAVPVFDSTLEYVLRQQLSSSTFLRVASPDRVRDALQLMRRPPDTVVDVAVGREVGLRDGAIRALVAGRIDQAGDRYDVSLDLVSPGDGRVVATDRRSAARQDEVLDAVKAQAEWARRTLGERLQDLAPPVRLERATTSSIQALQLYSRAMDLGLRANWAAAARLLDSAIQQDSQFALAHILLAHALDNTLTCDRTPYRDSGHAASDVLRHATRAHELALEVAEVERYFIQGSYLTFDANTRHGADQYARLREAATAYQALVQLNPNHYWGTNNPMLIHQRLGQQDLAATWATQRGSERPNDLRSQVDAAVALVAWKGTPEAAIPFVTKAADLIASGASIDPQSRSWMDLFPATWHSGAVARRRLLSS